MKFGNGGEEGSKQAFDMTPMIDVCFQLIIFFMVSLKLFAPEGDFNIKMPISAPSEALPDDTQIPPIKVTMKADADGRLASLQMNDRTLGEIEYASRGQITRGEQLQQRKIFENLRAHARDIVGDASGPNAEGSDAEVELDCDYALKYEYVVEAITAVSGYVKDGQIIKVIEKIKFSRPKQPT